MSFSRPETSVHLVVWRSLLLSLIQVVFAGQDIGDFSSKPLDCTSQWNFASKISNMSNIRSIFFDFNITTQKKCPFQEYVVTLVDLNVPCNYDPCERHTVNGADEKKSLRFSNLKIGSYRIDVEPISLIVNGQHLCKHEMCVVIQTPVYSVGPGWESDIRIETFSKSVKVRFELKPNLGFYRYNLSLLPISNDGNMSQYVDSKTLESPTNSCTFDNTQPGKYRVSIRPYERNKSEECICGNIRTGICEKCNTLFSEIVIVEKDPVSYKIIVIVVVSCVLIILIAITVIWFKRGTIYQYLVIIDKPGKNKETFHVKEMYNQKVLLVHGADFEEHETVIYILADILKNHCMCNITVVPSQDAKLQAINNQYQWLQKTMQEIDKVIIVISPCIHQKYFSLIQPPQKDLSGDMISQLLDYSIQLCQTESSWKQKIVLCRFNYTPSNFTLPFLFSDYCYELPQSLEDLILHIHNVPVDHLKIKIPEPNIECLNTVVITAQKYLEVKEIETLASIKCNRMDSEGYHSLSTSET